MAKMGGGEQDYRKCYGHLKQNATVIQKCSKGIENGRKQIPSKLA